MSSSSSALDARLGAWLGAHALSLDTESLLAGELLPRLSESGVFGAGVPEAEGGRGGDVTDAVEAVAAVSERSLAAGFVLWGHRSYIEYLLQSPNEALRAALLPDLLAGRVAGATGLSNAMKFLAGLERLQVNARPEGEGYVLDGKLPWVSNLRVHGFHVAAAVSRANDEGAFVASLAHDDPGVRRSPDLDLMGLRATSTAALDIDHARIDAGRIIHPDAGAWLPAARPAFLGLQCGMSIGLARCALNEARGCLGPGRGALAEPIADLAEALDGLERELREGLRSGAFHSRPAALFRIRIALADVVAQAVGLELQGSGGKAYLSAPGAAFGRRWREAAFIPVITPSLLQLKTALAAQRESAA